MEREICEIREEPEATERSSESESSNPENPGRLWPAESGPFAAAEGSDMTRLRARMGSPQVRSTCSMIKTEFADARVCLDSSSWSRECLWRTTASWSFPPSSVWVHS